MRNSVKARLFTLTDTFGSMQRFVFHLISQVTLDHIKMCSEKRDNPERFPKFYWSLIKWIS